MKSPTDLLKSKSGQNNADQTIDAAATQVHTIHMESSLTVTSPAFSDGAIIPTQFTCDGVEHSPPLTWSGAPNDTKSYVLLVHDPDAPAHDWLHWLVINIPPTTTEVAERTLPQGGQALLNDGGSSAYGGPCPPNGMHRYFFVVYALAVDHITAQTRTEVEAAITQNGLAYGTLLGRYQRSN